MKRLWAAVCASGCAVALFAAPSALAQKDVPEIPFDSVPDFIKLPPGMKLPF